MKFRKVSLALAIGAGLASLHGCGVGNNDSDVSSDTTTPPAIVPVATCTETGTYACKSGASEPLHDLQWHLNAAKSFFASFTNISDKTTDLNVESVHLAGIKGQGVKVLVIDDGLQIAHEDLVANVDKSMIANFDYADFAFKDPTPTKVDDAHGTNVAGIIGAAQNGIGVMGVAPRATLGGVRFLGTKGFDFSEMYGGAIWSKSADVINASYGISEVAQIAYDIGLSAETAALREVPLLRNGKGLIFVKAAGNDFNGVENVKCPDFFGDPSPVTCRTTADDPGALEPVVIATAAVNAKGVKSSYSTAGAANWISGLGGEYGDGGGYGEVGSGPKLASTDLMGCEAGASRTNFPANKMPGAAFLIGGSEENVKRNIKCNYSQMNGTSAATPTVSGVVALMLSANPKLTWRDVREILRVTARKIDPTYGQRDSRNYKFDLATGKPTTDSGSTLTDGDTTARLDFGWTKNAAGNTFSNWYGFGLVDAAAAVKMAMTYTSYKDTSLTVDQFKEIAGPVAINYGHVQKIGSFTTTKADKVDMMQVRLTGDVCLGQIGFYVKSPAGTVSVLSSPNSIYAASINSIYAYGLGTYAFFGEPMAGTWEVYSVSINGNATCNKQARGTSLSNVEYRLIAAK